MIEFHLDTRSGVAPYLQLIQQVRQALRLGLLREGDQLPTVKDVSGALAINPNTVLKAYRELEYEGLAAARPGVGTFVTKTLTEQSIAAYTELSDELVALVPQGTRRRAWTTRALTRSFSGHSGPRSRRKHYDRRHRSPRARQAVRATLGAVGLHAHRPGRSRRRSRRTERRGQDDPASTWPPGCSRRPPAASQVLGGAPASGPEQLARVGYVAQDTPTYAGLSVEDHLRLGAHLNPAWDDAPGAQADQPAGTLIRSRRPASCPAASGPSSR